MGKKAQHNNTYRIRRAATRLRDKCYYPARDFIFGDRISYPDKVSLDNPNELRMGWTVYEKVGICVINDYAIGKIQLGESE